MPADPPSSPALRASDADRDRGIELLHAAVADGRLNQTREGMPPRKAAAHALAQADPAIASADLILADTFTSLTFAGNQALPQVSGRGRHRAGRVRHGDALLSQPDGPHRPARLVAWPRRPVARRHLSNRS